MVYLYEKKIPNTDELVISNVKEISEYGIIVELPEYNNIKGYVSCSEISSKKKFKISNIMPIDKQVILIVLSSNETNNTVDLSKRLINDTEIEIFTNNYKIYLKLFGIFRYVYLKINNNNDSDIVNNIENNVENNVKNIVENNVENKDNKNNKEIFDIDNIDVDDLYEFMKNTLWLLQKEYSNNELIEIVHDKNKHDVFDKLEQSNQNSKQIKQILTDYVDKKVITKSQIIKNEFTLYTYEKNGVTDIKNILDYENFINESNVSQNIIDNYNKFKIEIRYMTKSTYNLNIELVDKNNENECDINEIITFLFEKIQQKAKDVNAVFIKK